MLKCVFIAITFSFYCFSALLVFLCLLTSALSFFFFFLGKKKPCECESLQPDLRTVPSLSLPYSRDSYTEKCRGGGKLRVTFRDLDLWPTEDNGKATTDRTRMWMKPWADQFSKIQVKGWIRQLSLL